MDAVKEFGIRAKDSCTSTVEAYEALGLSADNYLARMNEGGEVAEQAMNEIITALFNCNDAVVQNTAGVGLFGRW